MLLELWLFGSLGSFLAAGAAIAVFTCLVTRYWEHIVQWFRDRSHLIAEDETKVAFTLKEKMASGDCAFVQGIFNTQSETVEDIRRVKSKDADEELRAVHAEKKLAIYR